jgi:hypothetical protein
MMDAVLNQHNEVILAVNNLMKDFPVGQSSSKNKMMRLYSKVSLSLTTSKRMVNWNMPDRCK